jgi:hypothetical protein
MKTTSSSSSSSIITGSLDFTFLDEEILFSGIEVGKTLDLLFLKLYYACIYMFYDDWEEVCLNLELVIYFLVLYFDS